MTGANIDYYTARAVEEDRRAAESNLTVVRAVHLEMANAYRERAAEWKSSAQLALRVAPGPPGASGGAAQAAVKVIVVKACDRRKTADVLDHERAAA